MQGFAPADPANLSLPTAKDYTRLAKMLISSQPFIEALTAQQIGMQRITDIRNVPFVNDQGNFEYNPSFDFTVSYKQTIIQQTPSISSVEYRAVRV